MKRIPNWIIILLVIGILIAIKFLFLNKEAKVAGAKGKPTGVVTANYYVAEKTKISRNVYTTGKIGALNEIEIRPEVSGKITGVYFREGEQVKKGEPIIKINDNELQAQRLKIEVQIKLAEEKLERLKKLMAVKGVSQEEYDVQNNELEKLKADLAFVNAQLDKTTINAPFPGVIGLKNVSEGAYVSPLQVIASLVQLRPLFIEFSVPEKYSSSLKKGLNIEFTTETNASQTFSAQIYAIEPKVDEITKTLRGRALYTGSETFYPGSFVKVFVDLGKDESIMIPTQSLIPILKGQKVIVSKNGTAQEVRVVTGVRTEDKIQVLEGLNPGDTVLTTGLMSAKKDSKLKLIKSGN